MAAVGSVTYTEDTVGAVKVIKAAWTSDASGNVSGTLTTKTYDGEIISCATIPAGGGNQPTTYAIQFQDSNGIDVLCGSGTGRSITATEYLKKPLGSVASDTLQLVISGAGASKQGTAYLSIR